MNKAECCPDFDPAPWDEQEVVWDEKAFLKTRVRSIFHIPINFGSVMRKSMKLIEDAKALAEDMIVLADENSLWGADVYISTAAPVPKAQMTSISGTFLSKVFEGDYKNMRNWINSMNEYVASKGKTAEKLLFYYTTCPKCAKEKGKNFVVILAKIA